MGYDGSLKFDTAIDTSGFNSGIRNLGGIAKGGLSILGGAIAGVATAAGGGAMAAVNVGMSFESQMSKVQAISGATGDDLDRLAETAKEMGGKTKFSATEAAQAFEYMAMAGWKTDDMLDGIEGIMNLAAASGEDLATTSDIVTDALTAFGMSASKSGHFADILAAASSNANTNVGMMGETFKYAAPVAGSLGYSAEDTAVAIGLMANSGIKASQAGTSLRSIMTRLAKPTKESQIAMDALGLSITDSNGRMKPLIEIIGGMREGFSGLAEDEKASYAAMLGGQEAMSGLLAIVNASDEDFGKLSDAINNCNGSAAEMAEIMQDNLAGRLTEMKSAAEGLGLELYESVKRPLADIAKTGADAIRELTRAFKEDGADGLVEAGGKLIADVLAGIAGAMPDVITMAVQIISSIIDSLSANVPQILSAGMQILEALISGMAQILPAVGEFALNLMAGLCAQISRHAPDLLQKGLELLGSLVDGFVGGIPKKLPKILDFIQRMGEKLSEAAPELIKKGFELLSKLVEGITGAIPVLIEKIPRIITTFANIINDNFPTILALGFKLLVQLAIGIVKAVPVLIAHIPDIIRAVVSVFTAYNWLNLGGNIMKLLGNGMKTMASAAVTAAGNVHTGILNAVRNLPNALLNIGKNCISGLGKSIFEGAGSVAGKAAEAVYGIKNAFTGINWGSIGNAIIKGIANGITGAVTGLVNAAVNAGKSAFKAVKKALGINSPSRLFRDEVGRNMALGMGIGFEKNVPTEGMEASLKDSVRRLQHTAQNVTSNPAPAAGRIVPDAGSLKAVPVPDYPEFDYGRMGKETAKAMEGMGVYLDKKPVGRIIAPVVDDELGKIDKRRT